jgi:lipopolysaccharide transport system permease protein
MSLTVEEKKADLELPGNHGHVVPSADDLPETVIERRSGWRLVNLGELWRYRELMYFLAWRDVKIRYKQTVLGAAWALVQPLATMAILTLTVGRLPGMSSLDWPYPLFVFSGMIPWLFFSNGVNSAGNSVVGNQNLITKIYFPRLIIPVSAVCAGLMDFVISFGMLLVMMAYYGVTPGWGILLVPFLLLGLMGTVWGVGTLLAALTVAYRDVRYALPFMVQLWMFATPTIYMKAESFVGPRGQALLPLNPAYGFISNFRQAVLGGKLDLYSLGVSASVGAVLLLLGCLYFRRVEQSFADII